MISYLTTKENYSQLEGCTTVASKVVKLMDKEPITIIFFIQRIKVYGSTDSYEKGK